MQPIEPAGAGTRRVQVWDLLGIVLATIVALGAHHGLRVIAGSSLGHPWLSGTAPLAILALVAVALLAAAVIRRRPSAGDLPSLITAVWTDPPAKWVAGLLGVLLTTPVLGLFTSGLLGDADSARVIAAVSHVQSHGIGFITDTQDNFLPHVLLSPAMAVDGLAGVKLATLVSVQVLAGVIATIAHRITGSLLGAAGAALALMALPAAVDRAGYVPMYPTMLALGYLGGWLGYRAMTSPDRPWMMAAGAGACLALAPEAQGVGQLFLAVPVLLLVFAPGVRSGILTAGRTYLVIGVVTTPRILVNVSVDGLDRILSYRTDYWITKGYVREIQTRVWHYSGVDEPLGEYLRLLPGRVVDSLGSGGYVVLALAIVAALMFCNGRGRAFVLVVTGFMFLAVTVKQIPPFSRYYSPLWPGLAILVGVGVGKLTRHRSWVAKVATPAAAIGLLWLAGNSIVHTMNGHERRLARVEALPYEDLVAEIDDDRGVIGARSHALLNVTSDIPTWGGQFLAEEEYATYLTWPSDEAVIDVMERHDIGWVLIHNDHRLEINYHNVWLIPNHDAPARHVERIAESPAFCRVTAASGFQLYRLGPC